MTKEKIREIVRKQLYKLIHDSRHTAPVATIDINAPLALIQVEIDAKITVLKWVLTLLT